MGHARSRQKGPRSIRRRHVSRQKGVRKVRIRHHAHSGHGIRAPLSDGRVEAAGRELASESLRYHVEADRRRLRQRGNSRPLGGRAAEGVGYAALGEDSSTSRMVARSNLLFVSRTFLPTTRM